jgi:hypothetical protein
MGEGLTISQRKKKEDSLLRNVTQDLGLVRISWNDVGNRKMYLRIGTWNVKSLYRASSLKTLARKLAKYKLDLVAVQNIRWDEGGSQPADDYIFFYGDGNAIHHLGTDS